jgi:tellurite resistance protein TerC
MGSKIAIAKNTQSEIDPKNNLIIRSLSKILRISHKPHHNKFIVKENNVIHFTTLFLALIMVEQSDLIFALDSIPAVLAISRDSFIVYTSNIFAILGLRSFYFLIYNLFQKFNHLKYGISIVLIFVGAKMILAELGYKISTQHSLLFIIMSLTFSVIYSLYKNKK